MKCYCYGTNGLFTGEQECQTSPLDDAILVPINATLIPPPDADAGCYVAFDSGQWHQIPLPEKSQADIDAAARDAAKADRQAMVDAIKVTTSTGKTFDGDEISQTRMARAIVGMQATGLTELVWVLADNTPTMATLAELAEALVLAGQAQANVWVIE